MDKVALVTGASHGIGAATAKRLAREGYAVCVNYHHSAEKAESVVRDIKNNGGKAIALCANVGSEQEILALFEKVDAHLGNITALVNNAGINGGVCDVADVSFDTLKNVFETNVFGTMLCSREAIKRMKKNGKGAIVNVSSAAAKFGGTNLAHYAASKAAIETFTIGFAREAALYNVRVNAVSPGVIDTDMHKTSSAERIEALKKTLPMKRMGAADEVANLIYWLLSEEASYVSGAIVPVTGAR